MEEMLMKYTASKLDTKIAMAGGALYILHFYNNKIYCGKSSDNGLTWLNLKFPITIGYYPSNPEMIIDSLGNIYVTWMAYDSKNRLCPKIKHTKFDGTSWAECANYRP